MAVVDSAMRFINTGEVARLSDLMTPEAQVYAASTRSGRPDYRMRTAESQRAAGRRDPIIERGRIANLTYSIEQPPACRVHPDGPAPGTRGTPPT